MAIAKKVTAGNHKPGKGNGRFRVYSEQFNKLVDVVLEIEATDGVLTPTTVTASGAITSSSSSTGIGYSTGAGGAVTQVTNRTTGVTLNAICGTITTDNTSLAAEGSADFIVTNSAVAITDVVVLSIQSGENSGGTVLSVQDVAAGSFTIRVHNGNVAAGTAETGAILINFAVIKSVVA